MTQRDPRASRPPEWKYGPPGYGGPHWYRASRRATVLRLAIPSAIAITIAGFAIGAAVAYFSGGADATESRARTTPQSHAAPSTTGHTHASRRQAAQPSAGTPPKAEQTAPASAAAAEGHRLNDEGYALIQRGDYAGAIAPLREAVSDLMGTGPADPYEAYANYNLGDALLRSGRCTEAVAPLEAANRLETSAAVDRALREARNCSPAGS